MPFKVGDAVRLKAGGAQMTVSKLFKSPEGREMVQCTWFDKKSRVHRGRICNGFLGSRGRDNAAPYARGARLTDLAGRRTCECFWVARRRFQPRSPHHGIDVAEGMR